MAQVLASVSRRKLGVKLRDAVFTSLVALSNQSRQGRGQSQISQAVDRVFDKVLSSAFIDRNMLDMDDFI